MTVGDLQGILENISGDLAVVVKDRTTGKQFEVICVSLVNGVSIAIDFESEVNDD